MGIFNRKKNGGFMDEIRCDEPSYLIWKWRPSGVVSSDRENAIRWGSSLRVKDGEVAVFVYKQDDNKMQDYIVGPYDQIIHTQNFPVLAGIVGLAYEGGTPFQAEVYFINLAKIIQIKFGVPYFDVFDPRFSDFGVPLSVRGTVSFQISDYRSFIKLHRLSNFDLTMFQKEIRDVLARCIKNTITNAPSINNIPLLQIETKISKINEIIEEEIKERLKEDFGVEVTGVDISAIELDKASDEYKQLLSVTKDIDAAIMQAQKESKIKDIHDKQRIEAVNYEEVLRIQREEAQYAAHIQTQTSNFAAYQVESQRAVGVAGADALGQMGANGAADMNLSGGGEGFNMAGMMASMAIGGVVGQNIATAMNGITQPQTITPPIPQALYYIVLDNKANGPYSKEQLNAIKISKDTLVWTQGLEQWEKAQEFTELQDILPPEFPTSK